MRPDASVADAVGATPKETDAMTTETDEKPTLSDLLEQRHGLALAIASEYVTERWGNDPDAPDLPEHVREFLRLDVAVQAEMEATLRELGLSRG